MPLMRRDGEQFVVLAGGKVQRPAAKMKIHREGSRVGVPFLVSIWDGDTPSLPDYFCGYRQTQSPLLMSTPPSLLRPTTPPSSVSFQPTE